MSENITTYELRDPDIAIPMDRDAFYAEQIETFKATGKPTRACEVINIILFNKDGEIIVQKRSNNKFHNPGLIDKSIGGHIRYGESPFYTVMVETVQELRVPSIVLRTAEDFSKTLDLLNTYLDNIAIVKQIDHRIENFEKVIDGELITVANNVHFFLGVYSGATKPVDKEASGVLYYTLDSLHKEIKERPDMFTSELRWYLHEYDTQIQSFLSAIRKKQQ